MRLLTIAIHACLLLANATPLAAAPKPRAPKAVIEFAPQTATALAALEVQISDGLAASPARHPVSDAVLFVSKSGGDAQAALTAAGGTSDHPYGQSSVQAGALFNVRVFIVAGGKL